MRIGLRRRDAAICGLALAVMAVFVVFHLVGADFFVVRRLETTTLDLRLRLRGSLPPGPETAIVLIDDAAIAAFGRWPLPRSRLAELVAKLRRAGARVIAFDILFAEPETPNPSEPGDSLHRGDARLAEAMAEAGSVILPFSFRFGEASAQPAPAYVGRAAYATLRAAAVPETLPLMPTSILAPIPPLGEAAAGLGHVEVAFDVDRAARYDYPVIEHDLDFFPSLSVRVVQLYLGVPWNEVVVTLGKDRRVDAHDGRLSWAAREVSKLSVRERPRR